MNSKKEYLSEENYQKTKKKLTLIALIILIVGVLVGSGLIITGLVLSSNAKGVNVDLNSSEESTENLRTESEVQADINAITPRINSLNSEIAALEMELWQIQISEGTSDNYKAKQQEKETKEEELLNLKTEQQEYRDELNKIQVSNNNNAMNEQVEVFEGIFNSASNKISKAKYMPYYMFGGFIIIASGIISLSIFIFAKRREITAFTVQQTMPVAQEGIEKMSPTIGNAAGTIGKSIAKGIKEGINEADNNKK